jgi:methionyl-tRNA formyltransferase
VRAFGAILADSVSIWAHCGDGNWVEIVELQPAGKRRMTAKDFLRGNTIPPGASLGAETA